MSAIRSKSWKSKTKPKRVTFIRFQAMGDVVITLPYINDFKNQFPETELYFITTEEAGSIPASLILFDKVIVIKGGRNAWFQFFFAACELPFLIFQRHDIVMDLQNNKISRFIRKGLNPKAWCEFDRFSPMSAGERTRLTMESVGLGEIKMNTALIQCIDQQKIIDKLVVNGWRKDHSLIILNPAGAFDTRHWPLNNYVALATLLKNKYPQAQFLVMGLKSKLHSAVNYLKSMLNEDLIDLTGKTTPSEAFAIVKTARLMITEDSGLMHMAWIQAVPTLALFGSTRSDWSAPQGPWSTCLNSSDLACGNCMLERCLYGDSRCLTRYTPEFVFEKAIALLK